MSVTMVEEAVRERRIEFPAPRRIVVDLDCSPMEAVMRAVDGKMFSGVNYDAINYYNFPLRTRGGRVDLKIAPCGSRGA